MNRYNPYVQYHRPEASATSDLHKGGGLWSLGGRAYYG